MRKFLTIFCLAGTVILFYNCHSAKKVAAAAPAPTYATNLTPLIMAHCSPCHIPAKGGNKRSYDNFANVKTDIDEIIRRIELNPTDRGFMPFRGAAKLSDSTINVFKQWKEHGMLEN